MEDKIQGFVLQSVRYGDTSLIVKIFTQSSGVQSYMIKGVYGRSARNKVALFQQLNRLRFVTSGQSKGKALSYLKEVELDYVYQHIPFDIKKAAILMYVGELLSKTLTGQEQNEALYQFICNSMTWLDLVDSHYANFPLYFTLELSRFLGFYPQSGYLEDSYFDLQEGKFYKSVPIHPYYLDLPSSRLLSNFLGAGIDEAMTLLLSAAQRRLLLDGIIDFMRLHTPLSKGLQSHEVLRTVLG